MQHAKVILDRDYALGPIDPRLFGGFAEHMGRCIYTGLFEPGHPAADAQGFRQDVLALVRELDMPIMRYPGGNFVSGYNWEEGVGPVGQRPRRLELAWGATETNLFGTDEFCDWCKLAATEPMLAVNLGTRGPDDARRLVEYCNHPGGTALSDMRRDHGHAQPHGVKLWCLGNEMDGAWQMGYKTAEEYGRTACEAAKLMKWTDRSIELVACGSSARGMATFGTWERVVLEHCFEHVEYVSLHTYLTNPGDDPASFLARPDELGEYIDEVVVTADHVAALKRSRKRIMLSFDEWGVLHHSHGAHGQKEPWAVAPAFAEDEYSLEDALVVGGILIQLLNHADRVKLGCLAQVVNIIAPIRTAPGGPAWRQTIFWPLAQASRYGRGTALRALVDSPRYDSKARQGVPTLSLSAVAGDDGGLTLFALNRSVDEPLRLSVDARSFGPLQAAEHLVLAGDLQESNTQEQPDRVVPAAGAAPAVDGGRIEATLAPASWNVLRIGRAGASG